MFSAFTGGKLRAFSVPADQRSPDLPSLSLPLLLAGQRGNADQNFFLRFQPDLRVIPSYGCFPEPRSVMLFNTLCLTAGLSDSLAAYRQQMSDQAIFSTPDGGKLPTNKPLAALARAYQEVLAKVTAALGSFSGSGYLFSGSTGVIKKMHSMFGTQQKMEGKNCLLLFVRFGTDNGMEFSKPQK
jgi:hypothetical protein